LLTLGFAAPGSSFRVLRHEANRGRAAARNTGINAARGDFLLFLDADVAPEPGYLGAMVRALGRPGVAAAVGRALPAEIERGNPYQHYLASPLRGPRKRSGGLLGWKHFLFCVAGVRREAAEAVGPLDEAVGYGEDLEYGHRLSFRFPDGLRYVPEAVGRMYALGTLDTALDKMQEFGRDNLPRLVRRYPELALETGVDVVDSARGRGGLHAFALRALLRPWLASGLRRTLPALPPVVSDVAVRYLLGYTLARSYREGVARQESPTASH